MCFLPRQDQPGSPSPTGPPRPGRSASSDRGRPASLISDPAAASPAPASRALACPAAACQVLASRVLASQVAAFQVPYPCVSPPHDVPTFVPPCHHGLRGSLAPVIRDPAVVLLPGLRRLRADPSLHRSRKLQSLFHPPRPMAACGFDLVEQGVGWAEMATARARGCRAPPKISEGLQPVGGRRGSAGARESERLEPGLVGGGREAEEVGSAGRAADAPAGLVQHGQEVRARSAPGQGGGRARDPARTGGRVRSCPGPPACPWLRWALRGIGPRGVPLPLRVRGDVSQRARTRRGAGTAGGGAPRPPVATPLPRGGEVSPLSATPPRVPARSGRAGPLRRPCRATRPSSGVGHSGRTVAFRRRAPPAGLDRTRGCS